jgi:beta-glucosidase
MRQIADSVEDERALREIYLRQFEIAVKESAPCAVMTSYNRINGVFGSENAELMINTARERWGFQGIFITDWGAFNEPVESFKNGLDLEMPGSCRGTAEQTAVAVRRGELPMETMDAIAERLVAVLLRYSELKTGAPYDELAHLRLAQRVAEESAVLLKKRGERASAASGSTVAVLGSGAKSPAIRAPAAAV